MSSITIRHATPEDVALLAELIHSLAAYERMSDVCKTTPEALALHLFGTRPAAEALIAEYDGAPEGFALFFTTFSTFLGKPGIYLEDLFVKSDSRGLGIGKALLLHLVQLANERGCGRVEWAVLNWNESAIGFYKKLGAKPMTEWTVYRLSEDSISDLTGGR